MDSTAVERHLEETELVGEERDRFEFVQRRLLYPKVAASRIAVEAQLTLFWIDNAVALLTIAATCLGAYGLVSGTATTWAVWLEVVCAVALVLLVALPLRRSARVRWVQHRFLTELGRVALHCAPVGIRVRDLVRDAKAALPAELDPSEALVEVVVDSLEGMPECKNPRASEAYGQLVHDYLKRQIQHHSDAVKRKGRRGRLASLVVAGCFFAAAAVAAYSALATAGTLPIAATVVPFLQFASIVLPVVGASTFLWSVQREHVRMAARSARMSEVLEAQLADLKKAKTDSLRASCIRELARTMLLVGYEWSILMETAP